MYSDHILADNDLFSLSRVVYHKGHGYTPHSHKETAISIVLNGIMHEKVDGRSEIGKGAVTIIKPAGVVHENLFTEDCTILCLYLHKNHDTRLDKKGVLEEWKWRQGLNCLPLLSDLLKSKTEQQAREKLAVMLGYIGSHQVNREDAIPFWLADAKEYIDHHFTEPVNVTMLAARYKVHRVYLARAFRRYYGQNIKSYLKALRLHHSAASVINGNTVMDTALLNGFSDQSHLQRLFKEQTKQTPLQFRETFS
ncbi:AraC family transcriptional regulator [Sediminibacterium ginsengisoli]|uniref:AraC-type DNA-binding protein n=1 Tax=Sediminibacterium ginsengisoli TaxID=413434 RepID=A0A1T4LAQ5_9BACT|nr:AraC family transcriptional regulator [Sediminibacterium ginsengisoli]SJZ51681.1 AraC-type DNA-binding protein [Sediminibacterium ginsengisoli]